MVAWTQSSVVHSLWGRPAGRTGAPSAVGSCSFQRTKPAGGPARGLAWSHYVRTDPMQASAGPLPVPSLQLQLICSCRRCASYVLIISRWARCTAACSILLRSLCPQGPAGHCLLSFTNIKELFAEDATSSIRHARCQANNRIGASSPETGTRTLLLASVIGLASTRPSS